MKELSSERSTNDNVLRSHHRASKESHSQTRDLKQDEHFAYLEPKGLASYVTEKSRARKTSNIVLRSHHSTS